METKFCLNCKKIFSKPYGRSKKYWAKTKFCSLKCHYNYGRVNLKCIVCGKLFNVHKYRSDQKFCSSKCRAKVLPPPLQGVIIPKKCVVCGKEYKVKGEKRREKSRFCSKSCAVSGKNHWNWKGGITDENRLLRQTPKYNEWRLAVYRRDHWTCQDCHVKQKHPIAHHLKDWENYPKLRYVVSNGITLCRSCHKKRHKEIGNSTRFSPQ